MRDVAERVGLSRQLVSIVLRGAPGASDASRERILAAAREIGYHPDDSARMLRRRRSGQIGVLFTMRQPFELDLVDALYTRAGEQGFTLALSAMSPSRSQQVALDELMRQRIEALIALDAEAGAETLAGLPASIPTILLGGPRTAEPRDIVGVENKAGIELAVQHLVELGHRRIAYVGPERGPNAAERIAGYRDAMRALELPEQVEPSDYTEAGGYRAATELLRRAGRTAADATIDDLLSPGIASVPPGTTASTTPPTSPQTTLPTALICVNDHCAIGALQTLVRAGVSVPAQVSVIGFDDSTAAALPYIDLTSVRPDPDRMAELAVDAVRARLADPSAEATVRRVTPTLVVRGSTAVPRP